MLRYRYLSLFVVLAYLATGWHQIRPDERSVVRRFGRVVARPGPGLWIGLPWGVDRVDRVRVGTVRQLDIGYNPDAAGDTGLSPHGRFLTGDHNLVDIKFVVEYAADNGDGSLEDFLMNRGTSDWVLAREA
jgi:modulator of FtsH protease HflK